MNKISIEIESKENNKESYIDDETKDLMKLLDNKAKSLNIEESLSNQIPGKK